MLKCDSFKALMKLQGLAVLLVLVLASPENALAEDLDGTGLDSASSEALAKTRQLLENPALRDQEIHDSPNAQLVDGQVKSLTGNNANREEMYKISGKVLEDLAKASGGDAQKMNQLTLQGKDDPKKFYEGLSPESRKAIHDLAGKITNSPTTVRSPGGQH